MIRMCFVGNSHLASFKLGWDLVASELPEARVSFFGAAGRIMESTTVEGGMLKATSEEAKRQLALTSRGRHELQFADYDLIILVALGFSLMSLVELYRWNRSDAHNNPGPVRDLVSEAYFHEISLERLQCSRAIRLMDEMGRACGQAGVWLCPQPKPSISVLDSQEDPIGAVLRDLVRWEDGPSLDGTYRAVTAEISRSGRTIIEQPEETQISRVFTREEYSRGSITFAARPKVHEDSDYLHMNAAYGACVIHQIMMRASNLRL